MIEEMSSTSQEPEIMKFDAGAAMARAASSPVHITDLTRDTDATPSIAPDPQGDSVGHLFLSTSRPPLLPIQLQLPLLLHLVQRASNTTIRKEPARPHTPLQEELDDGLSTFGALRRAPELGGCEMPLNSASSELVLVVEIRWKVQ